MGFRNSEFNLPACLLVSGLLATTALAESQRREHDAHEHGVAQLNVAVDDATLHLELISPAVNIVGFEYHPATPEEHQAVADAVVTLKDGERLFTPDPAAGCQLATAEVDSELLSGDDHDDEHHDDEHHDEHHDDEHHDDEHHDDEHHDDEHHDDEHHDDEHHAEMHSEFHASYRFDCSDTASLQYLDVQLFQEFPGTESLQTQVIGPRGQTAQPLSPEDSRLSF